ncbi:MAG: deoxyribodipyrimidine photo-lyase, partial [Planctomycetes bacterium]|nr:deoxyribodipyrimidine photo-lyase [Planctomycetota bacterium]
MALSPTLVWFRQDLRVSDHPALRYAADRGGPVVPVFIHAPAEHGDWACGGASRVFGHRALQALDVELRDKGLRLIVRQGRDSSAILRELVEQTRAAAVVWNRCYEPAAIDRDRRIESQLHADGVDVQSFNGSLLYEPWQVQTQDGNPYKVYSPFRRMAENIGQPRSPEQAARKDALQAPTKWPESLSIDDLDLMPDHPWGEKVAGHWSMNEQAARRALHAFCGGPIYAYKQDRNRPDLDATTMLSPHLHWGLLSPHQAWEAGVRARGEASGKQERRNADHFLSELLWREFSYHVLYHFPTTPDENLNKKFDAFPWARDDEALGRWQKGRTGYPIVDAGMRQLWESGWMHNRVRMIVASFLTKDLRIHWREGARWFWDTLVDADLANNTQGWQWAGGCGTDAQPYFRIFNPHLQAKKFDPDGAYVRRWCPELAGVPDKYLSEPHAWGTGIDYPRPIVDHAQARDEA